MRLRLAYMLLCAVVALCSCKPHREYVTVDGPMLGTTFHIVAASPLSASEIFAEAMEVDTEAKASMSIFDPESLLSQINDNRTDSLDVHLLRNIAVAAEVNALSGGLYDITIKPLTEAYGFAARNRDAKPNIDSIMHFVGFDKFAVNGNRIVKSDSRLQLDLNSLAKGYTVDLLADRLEREGCTDYIVEVGGEIRAKGRNRQGREWRVGVDTPFDGNNSSGQHCQKVIAISDKAMATSGNYRRFYIDESGRKIAHTLNPRTGGSVVSRLLSATVVADRCVRADALATMFMAVGETKAIELAEQMRDRVQVYFILAAEEGQDEEYEIFTTLKE